MEWIWLAVLFFGGILAGFYSSNVGGGSLVGFPLLILTGLPTHLALGTNRISMGILEASSLIKFYKEGKVNVKYGLLLGTLAAVGSIIGATIVLNTNERYLNLIVAIILFFIFIILMNKDKIGIKEEKPTNRQKSIAAVSVFFIGIYGGFFGAGFGTFILFLLVLLGFSFVKGAATARLIGLMMSGFSAVIFAINGLISFYHAIFLSSGMAIGAWIGASIGIKKGDKFIKWLLTIVILASIVKLLLEFANSA